MVRLATYAQVLQAIRHGRSLELRSYLLESPPVVRALEAAARRGACVRVSLDRSPYGPAGDELARANRRVGRELAHAGCRVSYRHASHAKSLTVDGKLYLDERNWNAGDFIVRDDNASHVATRKREALAMEAALLRRAQRGDEVIVESERFDDRNPVFAALDRLAKTGIRPQLLLSREAYEASQHAQRAVRRLTRDGADVRLCRSTEKFAIAGDRVWLGSANATIDYGAGDPSDWGAVTRSQPVVAALRDRSEKRWSAAS